MLIVQRTNSVDDYGKFNIGSIRGFMLSGALLGISLDLVSHVKRIIWCICLVCFYNVLLRTGLCHVWIIHICLVVHNEVPEANCYHNIFSMLKLD